MSDKTSEDPVKDFDSYLSSSSFVFLLYYRGHWCPFCIGHLKELAAISQDIKTAGGTVVAVTSQAPEHLEKTRKASGFNDAVIVDPENLLAAELAQRGLLEVALSWHWGYPHSMAQPGLLVVKADGTVLQKWAIEPKVMNLGGATDRPVLDEVWKNVKAQLDGGEVKYESYATTGPFKFVRQKVLG